MSRISQADHWTVDLETGTGKDAKYPFRSGQMVGIAVRATGHSFYFPFRHVAGNLDDQHLETLLEELRRPRRYRGFNFGFDLKFLCKEGVPLPSAIEEVQTMAHLLNENEPSKKLKSLADKYIGKGSSGEMKDLDLRLAECGLEKGELDHLPSWEVAPYACTDVELTDKLHDFYLPHLVDWKLDILWREMNEYVLTLTAMELRGMLLDVNLIYKNTEEAQRKAVEAKAAIVAITGYPINTNSTKQLQAWLGLESTAKDVLEDLKDRPGVTELLDFRVWSKAKANYYDKFLWHMDSANQLHASFNYTGTVTGRLSASDPPMQAIPRYTEKYRIKDVIVARPGMIMFEADYGQAEIRTATHYADEQTMRRFLEQDLDIHSETAKETGLSRDDSKRLNFSVIYGIGARKFAERQGISVKAASDRLGKYHTLFPGWRRLYRRAEQTAQARGYIRMYTGRMRHYNCPQAPTHKASSNLIQGTVGEMLRIAIQKIHKTTEAKLDLSVHDSLKGELPVETHREQLLEIRNIMEGVFPGCTVKPKVDIKIGQRWGSLEKFT